MDLCHSQPSNITEIHKYNKNRMQISHKTLSSVQNLIAAATVAARTLEGTLQMFQQHLMAKLVSGQFIKLASFIAVTM